MWSLCPIGVMENTQHYGCCNEGSSPLSDASCPYSSMELEHQTSNLSVCGSSPHTDVLYGALILIGKEAVLKIASSRESGVWVRVPGAPFTNE